MTARWFSTGALLAAVGVALGAFGAHGLRGVVGPERIDVWETAVRYHLVHALALLAVGWAASRRPGRSTGMAGWSFVVGIALFSGSLYLLVLTGKAWLGAVTPVGGVLFLAGWVALASWRPAPPDQRT